MNREKEVMLLNIESKKHEAIDEYVNDNAINVTHHVFMKDLREASVSDSDTLRVRVCSKTTSTRGGNQRFASNCPECNSDSICQIGGRTSTLSSVAISQVLSSDFDHADEKERKILVFNNSVQDAAHQAGFYEARTFRFLFRQSMQQFINTLDEPINLTEFQRGFKDYYEQFPELQFSRTLTYIEVPVMSHVYFKMGRHNEIALDAGPKIGWFLTDTSSSNLPSDFGEEGSEYYVSITAHHTLPVSRKFDYGIQAGLGYEFKFGQKVSLQLQGRYYYGLANLWPDSKADDFEQSSNQSIQIVASLWWHHIIRGKKVKRNIDN
jgi:hypothetical protein